MRSKEGLQLVIAKEKKKEERLAIMKAELESKREEEKIIIKSHSAKAVGPCRVFAKCQRSGIQSCETGKGSPRCRNARVYGRERSRRRDTG